jgi:hypothetical protein
MIERPIWKERLPAAMVRVHGGRDATTSERYLDLKVVNNFYCQKLSSGVRQDVSPVRQFQAKQT